MGNIIKIFKSPIMSKRQLPVIVILGSTGTGKSKLAIELAKKFNGEIISADSMQVYKGLDIITNKVTLEEQKQAVHHFIDFLDPLRRYTVVDFRNQGLLLLNKLLEERKLPIIVGGTNYYIESLLWDVLISPGESEGELLYETEKEFGNDMLNKYNNDTLNAEILLRHKITQDSMDSYSSLKLHKCLQEVDLAMANMLHPGDKRKIIRSLQVFQQTGCCHSELLRKQRAQEGGSSLGGPLRFKNTVMFWLQCETKVLHKRLDDRVDEMIERGLIPELIEFHKSYNENRKNEDKGQYTEGIFQSIGFKEFHNYLVLSKEDKETEKGKVILTEAIEEMKLVTRQYSRKQSKWIVNRFLKKPDRQLPPVYGLDVTNLDLWLENVSQPAMDIVSSHIQGLEPVVKPLPIEESLNDILETHFCEICERVFVGRRVWEIHLQSKKHYRRKASLRKMALRKEKELQKTVNS